MPLLAAVEYGVKTLSSCSQLLNALGLYVKEEEARCWKELDAETFIAQLSHERLTPSTAACRSWRHFCQSKNCDSKVGPATAAG